MGVTDEIDEEQRTETAVFDLYNAYVLVTLHELTCSLESRAMTVANKRKNPQYSRSRVNQMNKS